MQMQYELKSLKIKKLLFIQSEFSFIYGEITQKLTDKSWQIVIKSCFSDSFFENSEIVD